ncbi:MAG: glycosyl hydrolase 108 family protein [Alphaproteobacteria bacterium]
MPISVEASASNGRTVDAMMKSTSDGELPSLFAGTLGGSKSRPVSEFGDFISQLRRRDPERAARFGQAVIDKLPAQARARLAQIMEQAKPAKPTPQNDAVGGSREETTTNPVGVTSGGSNSGPDDVFQQFRKRLAPREGGYTERPVSADPGGPTKEGMSQKMLNTLRKSPDWKHLPENAKDLSDKQINNIYRKEYFDRPQINKLHAVQGLKEAAPQLAEQVFDAGVLHGQDDAGKWLQQSLDKELGIDLRTTAPNGSKSYDGVIGTKTRKAVEQAVRDGKISAVNNGIVDRRKAYMRTRPNLPANKGWIPRAESFRMKQKK